MQHVASSHNAAALRKELCVRVVKMHVCVFSLEGVSPFSWPYITLTGESGSYEEEEKMEKGDEAKAWVHVKSITALRVWLSAVTAEEEQKAWSFLSWTWGAKLSKSFAFLASVFLGSKKRHLFLLSQSYSPHHFSSTWNICIMKQNRLLYKLKFFDLNSSKLSAPSPKCVCDQEAKGEDRGNCGNTYVI